MAGVAVGHGEEHLSPQAVRSTIIEAPTAISTPAKLPSRYSSQQASQP